MDSLLARFWTVRGDVPLLVTIVACPVFNMAVIGVYLHRHGSVRWLSDNRIGGIRDSVGLSCSEASGCKRHLSSLDL